MENFFDGKGFPSTYFLNEKILGPRRGANPTTHGIEVCIENLPPDLPDDYLYEYFVRAGDIYKIRIILDRARKHNSGTAYITYDNFMAVDKAITWNNFEIRPNCKISVKKSNDVRRLFLAEIPDDVKKNDVWIELKRIGTKGIIDVIMYKSHSDKNKNRKFIFIEFISHQAAEKELLKCNGAVMFGKRVEAKWAHPYIRKSDMLSASNLPRVIYIKNLRIDEGRNFLVNVLNTILGPEIRTDKIYKRHNFAFISFKLRRDAQEAIELLENFFKNRPNVIVKWARYRNQMHVKTNDFEPIEEANVFNTKEVAGKADWNYPIPMEALLQNFSLLTIQEFLATSSLPLMVENVNFLEIPETSQSELPGTLKSPTMGNMQLEYPGTSSQSPMLGTEGFSERPGTSSQLSMMENVKILELPGTSDSRMGNVNFLELPEISQPTMIGNVGFSGCPDIFSQSPSRSGINSSRHLTFSDVHPPRP